MMSRPRITVLGSGTSAGIPAIGCSCETCTSSDPRDVRTRTCAAVEWVDHSGQDRLVFIDAGPDLRLQALRHRLVRCDGVFVTHNHTDHIFGIDELRRFNAVMPGNPPVGVWAEPRCWTALRRVYQHVFDKQNNVNESFIANLVAHDLADPPYQGGAGIPIDLYGMRFTPIRTLHGKLPVLAFRIEPTNGGTLDGGLLPAAWITDTSAVPPKSWAHLSGIRTLFLDGLRPRRHPTHFTLEQAQQAAAHLGPDRTFLIHIAHEVLHARDEPRLDPGVRLAVDGLRLEDDGEGRVLGSVEKAPGEAEPYIWADAGVEPAGR